MRKNKAKEDSKYNKNKIQENTKANRELDTCAFAPIILTMFKYKLLLRASALTHQTDSRAIHQSYSP